MKKDINFFPLLLVIYEIIVYLSNDMYLPALPRIVDSFSVSANLAQLTITTCFLGAVSMQLIFGPMSDRYGRRFVLFLGGGIFILSTLVCGTATSILVLLIARFFQGMTVCSIPVAGYAAIHESYDHKEAIAIIAIMSSVTVLAPAFGPFLGSIFLTFISWRFIFLLLAFLATLVLSLLYFKMPDTNLNKREALPIKKLLGVYFSLLKNQLFLLYVFSFSLLFSSMIVWITAGPFTIISEFKHSTLFYGFIQILVFGAFVLGSRLTIRFIKRVSITRIIWSALFFVLIGAINAFLFSIFYPYRLASLLIPLILFSFGTGLSFSIFNRLSVEVSGAPMGVTMAILSSIMFALAVLGSIYVSVFYDGTLLILSLYFLVCAILSVCVFMISRFLNCLKERGK